MTKIKLVLVVLLLASCLACATTPKPVFQSVTTGDVRKFMDQTPIAKDHPNAGACLLRSHVHVELFKDGTSVSRHLERYKIFNERGRRLATQNISYRQGYQSVRILFAHTIRPDGRVVSLDPSDIHDATRYAGFDFYTDNRVKRFTMPAIEDGSVIEYAYEIKNLKPNLSNDYSTYFLIRNVFPIVDDILEIVAHDPIQVHYRAYHTDNAPEIIRDPTKTTYRFTNYNQNEIVPEPRMPALIDKETFPQIRIWTLDDWQSISKWYVRVFQVPSKVDPALERFTRELIADKPTREEKIQAIFQFVSQSIRYVAVLLGPHTHQPHLVSDIFEKRYGDCKDKTLLLLTMLKIAGVEGIPALVPALRDHFDTGMPTLGAFNHIMAVVPDGERYFWLDATNEVAAYDSVPYVSPTTVFLIHPDGKGEFVITPAPDKQHDQMLADMTFRITEDGDADIEFIHTYRGKAAEAVRYLYKYLPPEQRKTAFEKRGIEVMELELGGFADTHQPFTVSLKGRIRNLATKAGPDTMILSGMLRFDTYRDVTSAPSRHYPIVLVPLFQTRQTLRVTLPDGFRIKNVPEAFRSMHPLNDRKETFEAHDNELYATVETSGRSLQIIRDHIDLFKQYADELQKHEASVKSIILERGH